MDTSREIRYAQLLIVQGIGIEGIRFLDEDLEPIVDEVWDPDPKGEWSEL